MNVPFYVPSIGEGEISEVVQCLRSGWLTTGPRVKRFEEAFAKYVGVKHAIAVNSCTAALHLALEAVGLRAGDAVIVPTMTFAASAEVVRYFDAHPVLVDCREVDCNMDVDNASAQIEKALDAGLRVAAIIAVSYGGQVGDVEGIRRLARRYSLRVIDDAAHCCPAWFKRGKDQPWEFVGAGSDVSCFSFYANKTITTGEGGMACTNDDTLAERMRVMSLHGISKDAWKRFAAEGSWYYEIVAPGFKYNLTDIAAAIGIHQLARADDLHRERIRLVDLYRRELSNCAGLELPVEMPERVHSWHLFPVRIKNQGRAKRDAVISVLKKEGITTSVHWMPLHMHPYYRQKYGFSPEMYPVAARIFSEVISLPLYPGMTDEQVRYTSERLRVAIL